MRRVLIANRSEIARRVARTCRALGLEAVAVYSDADRDLPFVREADLAVRLGSAPAKASYLSVDALIAACRASGADAVHPGYGFLSEDAAFAQAVIDAGLTWVGPPPAAMRAMGDKVAARALAESAGVPVLPGYDGADPSDEAFAAAAAGIGYPVLVKAAGGGGGRGMRKVYAPEALAEAVASARREAAASFGSGVVFLEKLVERPRHVEVQLMCDAHGGGVYLLERECSIQRRHQKVVEEAPSPAVDPSLRARLGDAALAIARAGGYVGAGTAEFLLAEDGSFTFLELNARLQVEHPVTEEITGLDLVELQLRVARGEPLPLTQADVVASGHAIEVRLYAEDSLRGGVPSTGRLLRLDLPAGAGVRIDAGYASGDEVSPHYDPMIAKIIAHGSDRATALARLRRALEMAWAPGLATNLPLLRQLAASSEVETFAFHTGWLEASGLPVAPPLNLERGALVACALGWWRRQQSGSFPRPLAGFRLAGPAVQTDRWRCGDSEVAVRWRAASVGLDVAVGDGDWQRVELLAVDGDAVRLVVDGLHRTVRVAEVGNTTYVHFGDGEAFVARVPRFPPPVVEVEAGSLIAPITGTVTAVLVASGDVVSRGQALVRLEAMKMEHTVTAPDDGTVDAVLAAEGTTVDEGAVLVRMGSGRKMLHLIDA